MTARNHQGALCKERLSGLCLGRAPQTGEGLQVEALAQAKASTWRVECMFGEGCSVYGGERTEGIWYISDRLGLQGRMADYIWHAKTALNSKVKQRF